MWLAPLAPSRARRQSPPPMMPVLRSLLYRRALFTGVRGKKEEFSEVRRSKLSRSGGGLGPWTGAKRTSSRS
jgi:hypothetical protein